MQPKKPTSVLAATLVSLLAHIALVLILSLIVLRGTMSQPPIALSAPEPASETALLSLPDLEPMEAPASDEFPLVEQHSHFALAIEIPAPENLESQPVLLPQGSASANLETLAVTPAAAASIQRRVSDAGGQPGEVQFALAWKNHNDVDLHVVTPSGERISHLYRRSSDGGNLDVDMNVHGESDQPVENVRWLKNAPWGRFTVIINLFQIHRPPQGGRVFRGSEFQLLSQLGTDTQLAEGVVNRTEQIAVFHFRYVPLQLANREQLLAELSSRQAQEEAAAAPLLANAKQKTNQQLRERLLNNLIRQYPHTDTAIEAMQLLGGNISKP